MKNIILGLTLVLLFSLGILGVITTPKNIPENSNLAQVLNSNSPICEATGTGKCYYVSNKVTSGVGTYTDPFGMADFRQPTTYCDTTGVANNILQPGDYMYFHGGQYLTPACSTNFYYTAAIHPKRSGTPSQPITFKAYPGETPILSAGPGGSPAVLSAGDRNNNYNYLRFMGFTVKNGKIFLYETQGSELAYNDIEGKNNPGGVDTNSVVAVQDAASIWIHHNEIYGSQGATENNAGIQVFRGTNIIVEDNYVHDNVSDINDKEAGINNTYRRNLLTNSQSPWYGNNQPSNNNFTRPPFASYSIYENVLDKRIELHYLTDGAEVHDNLILSSSLTGAWAGQTWNSKVWNNVVLGGAATGILAYSEDQNKFVATGATSHLQYMDYNIYTATPEYRFGKYSVNRVEDVFNQTQMQGFGFEKNSKVVLPSDIYVDQVSYKLKAPYTTAGRYGDAIGPDNVAEILDLKRYGPRAMPGVAGAPTAPPITNNPTTPTTPTPPPTNTAPVVSISASPSSVALGQSAVLTWSSTNTTSCTASHTWGGTKSTSGTQSVTPTATTTYTITCTGTGGTDTKSAVVSIGATVSEPTPVPTPTPVPVVIPKPIGIGSTVYTTSRLNVRSIASPTARRLGVQPINAKGVIISGPTVAKGYTWWKVNFSTGADGWVINSLRQ